MSNIFDLFKQIETSSKKAMPPVSWLIVGLGNPGKEYDKTRHNNGFMAVDLMASNHNVKFTENKFKSICTRFSANDVGVLLMKPQTYMNNSGIAVKEALEFYKIDPSHLLVFSDDISLDLGKIRLRNGGSAGGHNGLKSIISSIGSDKFPRIKIGVGSKPNPEYDLADWVLSRYTENDMKILSDALNRAVCAAELVLLGNSQEAMNKYN